MVASQQSVLPELVFARRQFADYYSRHSMSSVRNLESREFGFMFFDKTYVHRHVGFSDAASLGRYLSQKAPSHAYYSAAYYQKPWAGTMKEKEWLGADLIFDLDADHVRGSESLPYQQMLQRVKEVLMRLYDEFICADFGFSEKDTEIVFSGGRGYHIHVYSDAVRRMGNHERREIVDYITAQELDLGILLSTRAVEETGHGKTLKSTRLPELAEGGWYAKTRMALTRFLDSLESMTMEQAIECLTKEGMTKRQAERMHAVLFEEGRKSRLLNENILDLLTDRDGDMRKLISIIRGKSVEWMGGQTDEPVTSDIHRLIRLPGSLHGKTSLKVVSLTREELAGFDPLRDAVADFPEGTVSVLSERAFTSDPLGGEAVSLVEGLNEIPLSMALFLILRRKVTMPKTNC